MTCGPGNLRSGGANIPIKYSYPFHCESVFVPCLCLYVELAWIRNKPIVYCIRTISREYYFCNYLDLESYGIRYMYLLCDRSNLNRKEITLKRA